MLPLPTEATVEAMNVSTNRRHPFHTYNDRNWFRQFGFTQQNIIVDIDDVERDMEISNGEGSLRHWCLGYSQCFSVIRYSDITPLFCSTSKLTCFGAICHRLPLFRQAPVWFGRSSKNMYMGEPESWNHSAIDSLNCSLLEQNAAIIASFKERKKEKKKRRSWLTTILSSYSVQSVSSFRRHLHCIMGMSMDFPDLKAKTND